MEKYWNKKDMHRKNVRFLYNTDDINIKSFSDRIDKVDENNQIN